MEEVMNALKMIQKEMVEQKALILESGNNITEHVTQNVNKILEERLFIWEEKQNQLKEKVEDQERRIYFLEKQARQRNVVFFGIEEVETSYLNLENKVIGFIDEYFSVKLDSRDIQEIKRLGRKGERPRPIIVTFSTLSLKINIIKQKGTLKDTPYYMKEDYPKYVLEKRRMLQKQLLIEREKGNIAFLKYDRLVVLDHNVNITNNNKRTLSSSPENDSQKPISEKSHANKKNKPRHSHTLVRSSPKVLERVQKPGMLSFLTKAMETNP